VAVSLSSRKNFVTSEQEGRGEGVQRLGNEKVGVPKGFRKKEKRGHLAHEIPRFDVYSVSFQFT